MNVDVCKSWTKILTKYIKVNGRIGNFRAHLPESLQLYGDKLYSDISNRMPHTVNVLSEDPFLKEYLSDSNNRTTLINNTFKTTTNDIILGIISAALIYHHSLLDAVLIDLLELLVEYDSELFKNRILQKQINVQSLMDSDIKKTLADFTLKVIKGYDRESIKFKINIIQSVCKPKPNKSYANDYEYSEDKLTEIDNLRHDLVHLLSPTTVEKVPGEFVDYLDKTTMYVLMLVRERINAKIDIDAFTEGMKTEK